MESLNIVQIIHKKSDALALSEEEIQWFVRELVCDKIMDYQVTALLMAIFINGMNHVETAALTKAVIESGKQLVFNNPCVVDKHSTGGVGDKTSFIVGPLAAACGVKVPMISGRGLGHTGGTVDKIESIPNFNTRIPLADFPSLLEKNGFVLATQTDEIAPADKRLYALRDVTSTTDSVPLITASIMGKKLAEGISGLVLDVKYGSGALAKDRDGSLSLAHSMAEIGRLHGVNMMVFITNMNWPLGDTVGHSLEIIESVETLRGEGPKDLEDLSLDLAAGMIYLAGKARSFDEGRSKALQALKDGKALKKFEQVISAQGGDSSILSDLSRLPLAMERYRVRARSEGYVENFKNDSIGLMVLELGGGRKKKEDSIDFSVGLKFEKKPGDFTKKGDTIFTFYHHKSQRQLVQSLEDQFFQKIMRICQEEPLLDPLVLDRKEYLWHGEKGIKTEKQSSPTLCI